MIGPESVKYSLRNLKHRKMRSFFTVLSIFIGIMTVFIFASYGLGLYNYIDEMLAGSSANKVIVQGRGFSAPGLDSNFILEEKDVRAVENSAGVIKAEGIYMKVAELEFRDRRGYGFITGYDPREPLIMDVFNIDIEEGRELMNGDDNKVVLGYNYMVDDKIFPKAVGLNDKVLVNGKEMRVVGFYESLGNPQDDSNIYLTLSTAEEIYAGTNLSYAWIIAEVETDRMDQAIENIERNLRNVRDQDPGKEDFFVQSFEDMIASYMFIVDIILIFIALIVGISILVSAINTANTMITSVIERTKEIGILKSIGSRNSEIFGIFLFESSFLGFIAGSIGVALGLGFSELSRILLDFIGYGFLAPSYSGFTSLLGNKLFGASISTGFFQYDLFVFCILFATITGALSGAIPAWRASRTNIVDALRYE